MPCEGEVCELSTTTIWDLDVDRWIREENLFSPGCHVYVGPSEKRYPMFEEYEITGADKCGTEWSPFYRYYGRFVGYIYEADLPVRVHKEC